MDRHSFSFYTKLQRRFFLFAFWLPLILCLAFASAPARAQKETPPPALTDSQLLTEIERRAFRFFWEKCDPATGMVNDRARNRGTDNDEGDKVSSIASTGYALAALPVAVEHGWIARDQAYARALTTLRYLHDTLPNQHGWYYHFIDRHTGQRVWNCELSSIDTCWLLIGALVCGQYWRGTEADRLANALYDRVDWTWMRTNGGTQPQKKLLSMGWTPEKGFLTSDWGAYSEMMALYLLGLGAKRDPLPVESWIAWTRNVVAYGGRKTLAGGPIFMHQMSHGYYDFHNRRDRLGWDYWVSSQEATYINRQFCRDKAATRKTYAEGFWGLNANDAPDGYRAYSAPGEEDGTVSSTGALDSLLFTPDLSIAAAKAIYTRLSARLWGRYGFSDSFNLDRDWYDPDVIGIDLGMTLIDIEDYRTGRIWRLLASHPSTARALQRAGFHKTVESSPRSLQSTG